MFYFIVYIILKFNVIFYSVLSKVDYFERAKRLEEIPLLQKSLEEKQVQDKAFWEQQEKERIEQLIGKIIL